MNKKQIIALLIVIFALGYYNAQRGTVIVTESNQTEQNLIKTVPVVISGPCDKILFSGDKDLCYLNLAKTNQDVDQCSKINDQTSILRCISELAVLLKKPELCIKLHIDDVRDDCYRQIAVNTSNFILCGAILFDDSRANCYDSINLTGKDPNNCGQLWTQELRSECRFYVGEAN